MKIYEDSTRFVFEEYSEKELQTLRRLISADGNSFLYEEENFVACPIGVEKYIKRKFPDVPITKRKPWDSNKMKKIPEKTPPPRNRLQKDALKFLRENKERNQLGLITNTGSGKCQPYSTLIPTPNGLKKFGQLKVGDEVYTQDGSITKVNKIHEQGERAVYQLEFEDGRTTKATVEHLWNVSNLQEEKEMTTGEIDVLMKKGETWYIPLCQPVFHQGLSFNIDPYVHGVITMFMSVKPKTSDGILYLSGLSEDVAHKVIAHGGTITKMKGSTYFMLGKYHHISEALDSKLLDRVLMSSIRKRQSFMDGVLEACVDHYLVNEEEYHILTHNDPVTIGKISDIAYSLGWKCRIMNNNKFCIVIPLAGVKASNYLKIVSIKRVKNKQNCRCIEVEDPSHTYLTNDYLVTHNTYMSIKHAIQVGEKTLIICPTTAILNQWVKSLTGMFQIPEKRILHITGTDKLSQMKNDFDWVLVLEQTLQTLVRRHALEETLEECHFGLKITDEIHMFMRNNIAIDCSSNIKRSLYCTGTFFRTQQEESNLFEAIYHNILRFEVVEQEEIERYGQPKHIEVYSVVINSRLTKRQVNRIIIHAKIGGKIVPTVSVGRYMEVVCPTDGQMTPYIQQSLQVIKRMRERVDYGRMLVLVPSIYATKQFRKLISDMFPKLKVGSINSEQSRYLNNTVKEEADIIVSTSKSAGVGFDMSDLSILVAVEQFRSAVLVEQISGRLRPRADKKHTYYVDIADASLGSYLLGWREDRLVRLKKKAVNYRQFKVAPGDK